MSSTSPSHSPSSFSGKSSNSDTPPSPPRKMRSLDDLYEVTNLNDDVTLYCYLATCDLIVFETTIKYV
jgi:ATP-dependent Clp protease adapter protein ClpS